MGSAHRARWAGDLDGNRESSASGPPGGIHIGWRGGSQWHRWSAGGRYLRRGTQGGPHRRRLQAGDRRRRCSRSEEHTSELQSLRQLVCRLLLENKNQQRRDVNFVGEGDFPGGFVWFGGDD